MSHNEDMSNTYTVTSRPKGLAFVDFDCAICQHETLKRPIFLAGPSGVIAAGTGCAAELVYGTRTATTKVRNAADGAEVAATNNRRHQAERANHYAKAIDAFFNGDDVNPDLNGARRDYSVSGGYTGTRRAFPVWMLTRQIEAEVAA